MTNMAVNQRRWLLRMQSGDSELPIQRPVEVPDQNIPPELEPQQRPQEASQPSQTPQIRPSQTPTEISQSAESAVKSDNL
jgi:hypothetical protein